MYAIIRAGGRQYKVTPGDRISVDLLSKDIGEEVVYKPLLVVSQDGRVLTGEDCDDWPVRAEVVGTAKGEKIRGFKYKPKTGYRRRWGHRQKYTILRVVSVGEVGADGDTEDAGDADTAAEEG